MQKYIRNRLASYHRGINEEYKYTLQITLCRLLQKLEVFLKFYAILKNTEEVRYYVIKGLLISLDPPSPSYLVTSVSLYV